MRCDIIAFMDRPRFALCLLLSSAWLGVPGTRGHAAELAPLGPEIELFTDEFPKKPLVAVQPGGAYVIAWDNGFDTPLGISYYYIAAGSSPEDVWPSTIGSLGDFLIVDAVTATPKGFDVLWHPAVDDEPRVFYRSHLNLRGVLNGKPLRLGGAGTEWIWYVRGNGFMAGWALPRMHGIAARRLTSSGRQAGPELRLNSRPVDGPDPVVLAVADGGFLAIWLGAVPGPSATTVLRARRFAPAGKPLGPDFDVNTIPGLVGGLYVDNHFKAAAAPGGGFAVAWMLDDTLYLRFFDAAGTALGPEIPVVAGEDIDGPASMAFDNVGNLLLLWELNDPDLRLQLFDRHGKSQGLPVGVRSEASDIFELPWGGSVAWAGDSWLVTWVAGVPDLEFSTIFVRRFAEQ
jgi:hypothetical protein